MQSIQQPNKRIQISGDGRRHQFGVNAVLDGVANALGELRDKSVRVNTQSLKNTHFNIGGTIFKADDKITTSDPSDSDRTLKLPLYEYAFVLDALGLIDHHNNQQSKIAAADARVAEARAEAEELREALAELRKEVREEVGAAKKEAAESRAEAATANARAASAEAEVTELRDEHSKDADAFKLITRKLNPNDSGDELSSKMLAWLPVGESTSSEFSPSLDNRERAEQWFPPCKTDRELATAEVDKLLSSFGKAEQELSEFKQQNAELKQQNDELRDEHSKDTDAFQGIAKTLLSSKDVDDHIAMIAKWFGDEGSGVGSSQASSEALSAMNWFPDIPDGELTNLREFATTEVPQLVSRFTQVKEDAAAANARADEAEAAAANALESAKSMLETSDLAFKQAERFEYEAEQLRQELHRASLEGGGV